MATEGKFFQAKDEIESKVYEIAKKYELDTYQVIRILSMMIDNVAYHARDKRQN